MEKIKNFDEFVKGETLNEKTARHPLEPLGLILCPKRQSMQSALWCKESESAKCPS